MILAESLAMANRNDNDKQVKIDLQKCFTKGCCVKEKKFPQEMARIRQKSNGESAASQAGLS